MRYALPLILFFTFNIILISKFKTLGMIPMHYLVSGMGASLFFNVKKYNNIMIYDQKSRCFLNLSFVLFFLISLFHFSYGFRVALGKLFISDDTWFQIISVIYFIFVFVSCLLFIINIFIIFFKNTLFKWTFYSLSVIVLKYGILILLKNLPTLLFRYYGIFDLLMLFGWLMIIFTLFKDKYEVESFGYSDITVR